jgi:hypothetical protein
MDSVVVLLRPPPWSPRIRSILSGRGPSARKFSIQNYRDHLRFGNSHFPLTRAVAVPNRPQVYAKWWVGTGPIQR